MDKKHITVSLKELKPLSKDDKRRVELVYREDDTKGYFDNNVTISFMKNGAIYLSMKSGENSVYLMPAQVKQLKLMLGV